MATSEDRHLQSTAARPPDKGWVMNMEKINRRHKNVLNREHCFCSKEVTKDLKKITYYYYQIFVEITLGWT